MRAPSAADRGRAAVACAFLLAYAAVAVPSVWTVPFPNGYDELAHLSYIVHLAQTPLARLDLSAMRLLRPGLGTGFTEAGNYLNHPPGYYLALGALLPPQLWPDLGTVHLLRLVNAVLSTTAVGLALAVGVLRRLPLLLMVPFAAAIVLVPVMQVTGSGISNDNLALLGGCLAVFGAQAMAAARRGGPALLVAGCVLAVLAKFTAAMAVGVFAALFLLAWQGRRGLPLLAALCAASALAGLPYLWFALRFGGPVPVTPAFLAVGAEAAAKGLTINGWTPGGHLGLADYAPHFLRWMVASWSPVLGIGGWAGAAILLAPCLMLLAALPGFALNPPGLPGRDAVLGAAGVALLATLLPHLVFSWTRYHVPLGAPPFDAVPRYYLPIALAAVPAAACWTLDRLPPPLRAAGAWALLAATVAALPILSACHDLSCW